MTPRLRSLLGVFRFVVLLCALVGAMGYLWHKRPPTWERKCARVDAASMHCWYESSDGQSWGHVLEAANVQVSDGDFSVEPWGGAR